MIDMRLIINDEILTDYDFLSLEKNDILNCLKITSMFANQNKHELDVKYIKALLSLDDEFFKRISFAFESKDGKLTIIKYFNWFKNNAENVRKSRGKVNDNTPVIDEEKDVKERIDFERIKENFNNKVNETKIPSIDLIGDDRKKLILNLYKKMSKELKLTGSIYEFYEVYFSIILKDKGLCNGWPNTKAGNHFQPKFNYILKEKVFTEIYEKYI